jgi:hypothetical protein
MLLRCCHRYKLQQLIPEGEIHETLQICKSLTKRQIQCFNNVGCHGFEFATPYRALPSFVNDPLSRYYWGHGKLGRCVIQLSKFLNHILATHNQA